MSAAQTILRAGAALQEAEDILAIYGPLFASLQAAETIALGGRIARAEILVALREPPRQLVTLLHNRSQRLREDEEDFRRALDQFDYYGNLKWGAF